MANIYAVKIKECRAQELLKKKRKILRVVCKGDRLHMRDKWADMAEPDAKYVTKKRAAQFSPFIATIVPSAKKGKSKYAGPHLKRSVDAQIGERVAEEAQIVDELTLEPGQSTTAPLAESTTAEVVVIRALPKSQLRLRPMRGGRGADGGQVDIRALPKYYSAIRRNYYS